MQIELLGRTQQQQSDHMYYTCVEYIKVVGTPVYDFVPVPCHGRCRSQPRNSSVLHSQCKTADATAHEQGGIRAACQYGPSGCNSAHVTLTAISLDPLLEAGGLQGEAKRNMDPSMDFSDNELQGDSDDNDWDDMSSSSEDDDNMDLDQVAVLLPAMADLANQPGAEDLLTSSDDEWPLAHE